jgi:ABC-type antimicrobial peptide transport system permease subunit
VPSGRAGSDERVDHLHADALEVADVAVVAGIGVYGLVALAVSRRRREIAVRLALGALPRSVCWFMLGDVGRVTTVGIIVGSIAALGSARFLSALIFGLSPADLPSLGLSGSALGIIAAIAGYLPARRASRLSPATALHE